MKPRPISTIPVSMLATGVKVKKVLVWVADGGDERKGAWAFGWAFRGYHGKVVVQADGYSTRGWTITHWCPLPERPQQ